MTSVWTRPKRGREQPALSQDQIVSAAIEILDTEGLDALSMRRLGTRLNAGATSLYRHVTNRDELIELVVDHVYGEIELPGKTGDWRAALTACAAGLRAMILRHPWIASVLGQVGMSYLGPNVMRLNEGMLTLFESAGFPGTEANQAISAVSAYVIGVGISEAAWLTTLARSGQTEQEWAQQLRPAAEQAAEGHPKVREQLTHSTEDPARTRELNFAYGLDRMLDGLAVRRA